jgi:aminopeptidase N
VRSHRTTLPFWSVEARLIIVASLRYRENPVAMNAVHPYASPAGRILHCAAAVFLVSLLLGATGATEPRYSFDTTPGKLSKTVIPLHYAIDLDLDSETLKVTGSEVVDIEVREATTGLVLNANNITLTRASIDTGAQHAALAVNADAETVTLTFPHPLPAGHHKLHIAFSAPINKSGPGLYAVDYPTEQGTKRLISSHFAPGDARRMFPSWDEPAFKATFTLTVTVPSSLLAVSNMPIVREERAGPATKKVSFAPTPRMSSYLLELTVGELERLTGEADGVAVSVVTTSGNREQGRFALVSAIELLRYFNDYSGVKYPLPKLDLIAVPQGHVSAMEHWGAITFREDRLFLDPAANPGPARRAIFRIVAHELAHQWFGNLVTMSWWDNLWLNEGFATWMEAKATEHFHPRWQTWLDDNEQKQAAMNADAASAHPIQQPIADESEASEMFDNITYNKAAAVVRMLEGYVGEAAFQAGLRQYLLAHAYGNTTGADLWHALETASGKSVGAIASAFIKQRGVPLVVAEATCAGDEQRLALRQERFTLRRTNPAAGEWQVPITIGQPGTAGPGESVLLHDQPIVVAAGRCDEPVKLNLGDIGYYRVEYDAETRAALTRSMHLLSPADRVGMLADLWALVEANRAPASSYLDLMERIGSDDSPAVWAQIIRTLKQIDHLQRDRSERAAFQSYARARLHPVLERMGWDGPNTDGDGGGMLRPTLIRFLGELGDEDILAEARSRFAAYLQDPRSLRQGLRDAVIHLVGVGADRRTYDMLLSLARQSNDAATRERYYLAAASARDPALARRTLTLTLSNEVPAGIVGKMIDAVAWQGEQTEAAWAFLQKNFNALAGRQGPAFRDDYVASFMKTFSDGEKAAELAGFAPAHATSEGRAVARRAAEEIQFAAEFKARALPAIDAWIRQRAAAQQR